MIGVCGGSVTGARLSRLRTGVVIRVVASPPCVGVGSVWVFMRVCGKSLEIRILNPCRIRGCWLEFLSEWRRLAGIG